MSSSTSRALLPESTQTHHDRHGLYPEATSVEDFRHNLTAVQARIAAACQRVGRDPAGQQDQT